MLKSRTAADAYEEALYRLPTSATCMNLPKLPPYGSWFEDERCCASNQGIDVIIKLCDWSNFTGMFIDECRDCKKLSPIDIISAL
ncbi:hypothetical protein IFM89_003684 [Coptis chinensis]|uniref:Uncharacterized protein n=1 Tax=Coptis chinensis TaxID=261450 RepID=A0A835IVX9_9MAGN|nr:hypothetical protein IFM89_003684 [Coptis chinensis]